MIGPTCITEERVTALNLAIESFRKAINSAQIKEMLATLKGTSDLETGLSTFKTFIKKMGDIEGVIEPALNQFMEILVDFLLEPDPQLVFNKIENQVVKTVMVFGYTILGHYFPDHVNRSFLANTNGELMRVKGIESILNAYTLFFLDPGTLEKNQQVPPWFAEIYARYYRYLRLAAKVDNPALLDFLTDKGQKFQKSLQFFGIVASRLGPSINEIWTLMKDQNLPLVITQAQQVQWNQILTNFSQNKIIPKLKGVSTLIEGVVKGIFRLMEGLERIILSKTTRGTNDMTLGQYAHHLGLRKVSNLVSLRNSTEHMDVNIEEIGNPSVSWQDNGKSIKIGFQDLMTTEINLHRLASFVLLLNEWYCINTLNHEDWTKRIRAEISLLSQKIIEVFNSIIKLGVSPKTGANFIAELIDIYQTGFGNLPF